MKKITALAVLIILIMPACLPGALASTEYIDLIPGIYEIGVDKDLPMGDYDIRFNGLDQTVTVAFSEALLEDGTLDMTQQYSFTFTFSSGKNWWNIGGFTVRLYHGYLQVSGSPCRLWPED